MRRRGFTLLAVLGFTGLWLMLTLAGASLVGSVRQRVEHSKMVQAAAQCAVSGADYAEGMVRSGRWGAHNDFTSPDLNGTGTFTVVVRSTAHGIVVQSTGSAGGVKKTVERSLP